MEREEEGGAFGFFFACSGLLQSSVVAVGAIPLNLRSELGCVWSKFLLGLHGIEGAHVSAAP